MSILDQAYSAIQEHSIIWTDPSIHNQLKTNYLNAKLLASEGSVKQLEKLIDGIAADCLFVTTNSGIKISPSGTISNNPHPPITFNITQEKSTLNLPHFDRARNHELRALLDQLEKIKLSPKIEIDLRGNLGQNGSQALLLLHSLFGKDYVDQLQHKLYKGVEYRWRVSPLNLTLLQEAKTDIPAFKKHLEDVVGKMRTTTDAVVTSQVPDYDVPEEKNVEPEFKGKIILLIDNDTKSAAQFVYLLLENTPNVTIIGSRRHLQRFGETLRIGLDANTGLMITIPRKEEVLKR